jgi:beta-lactamase regulating signal transducer with metallopeptidase domain
MNDMLSAIGLGAVLAWIALWVLGGFALSGEVTSASRERALVTALLCSVAMLAVGFVRPASASTWGTLVTTLPLEWQSAVERAYPTLESRHAPALSLLAWIGALWTVAAAAGLTRLGAHQARWRALIARAAAAPDFVRELTRRLASSLEMDQPDVFISAETSVPVAGGIWRPAVLLPSSLASTLALPSLETVLRHELCHLQRQDPRRTAVIELMATAFTGHPTIGRLLRELTFVREAIVDAAVAMRDPAAYARVLVEVAEWRHSVVCAAADGIAMARESLRRRIEMVLAEPGTVKAAKKRLLPLLIYSAVVGMGAATWPACGTHGGEGAATSGGARLSANVLSEEAVVRGAQENSPSLGPCLKEARVSGQLKAGEYTFVLGWTIRPDGSVEGAQLTAPEGVAGTPLGACMTGAMLTWRFPSSDAPTPVQGFPVGPISMR